ncbi:MAG: thermonuclease family protein [Patulibacter minatonensis]
MDVRGFKVLGGVAAAVLVAVITTLGAPTGETDDSAGVGAGAASAQRDGASAPLTGQVEQVVDGDTLRVRVGGRTERVRLIGIDAPELSATRTGSAQCGGAEAFAQLAMLAPRGSSVELVADPRQDARDRFGRMLAFVSASGSARTFQEELLAAGWARVYVYDRRPFARVAEFREVADGARRDRAGVWDECGGRFDRPVR